MQTGRRTIRKLYIAMMTVFVSLSVFPAVHVFAGDINAEEQRVISAASGTFHYGNDKYKAKDEYISQLKAYLSSDDVDLDAEQADEAIRKMYASIKEGIDDGYLYKLEDETTEALSTEDTTDETTEDETEDTEELGNDSDRPDDLPPDATEDKTPSDKDKRPGNKKKEEETVIVQPEPDKAIGVITYNEEKQVITYYNPNTDTSFDLPSIAYPGQTAEYTRITMTVLLVFTAFVIVCFLILWIGKCFPFQKKKRSRTHTKYYVNHAMRKRIRRILGVSMTVVLALHILSALLILGGSVSLFRNQFVIDHLTSSGYYRYIYNEMYKTMESELSVLSEADKDALLSVVSYDKFLFLCKKSVSESLAGRLTEVDLKSIEGKLADAAAKTTLDAEKREPVISLLKTDIKTYTVDVVGSSIYGVRKGLTDILRVNLAILIINMALMTLLIMLMDRYRHRGVRYISWSVFLGAGLLMLAAGAFLAGQPYSKLHMEPEYLFLFIVDYLRRGSMVVLAIGAFGVLLGAGLSVLANVCRNYQDE